MRAGWRQLLLGELCAVQDSKRVPITKRDRVPGAVPYYGATGVLDHVADWIFNEPLVLVGEDGAKWESGEPTAFAISGPSWVNNHAHVVRPHRDKLLDSWLIYYINHLDVRPFVTGLTVPKLNQDMLRSIPIVLPPLPEQQRIVAILDEAFEGIAAATANTEKNLANARELFESYVDDIFGRLAQDVMPAKLMDACRQLTVGHVGPMAALYKQTGIPFLRSQNIRPFQLDLSDVAFIDDDFDRRLAKSRLLPGDVAIVRTGYPGTAAVIPQSLPVSNCADLVIARPGPRLNPEFLVLFLNSSAGKSIVSGNLTGAAQKHFNVTAAKQVFMPLPGLGHQQEIVEQARDTRAQTTALEGAYTRKLAALAELKQSLLARAFSGELTAAGALAA